MPDLDAIKDQLRRLDVLSGLAGTKAGDADLAALCEEIAFNDVADLVAEVERLRTAFSGIRELVDRQAEDDGLWFEARYITEAYLQTELRKLHAATEIDALERERSTP